MLSSLAIVGAALAASEASASIVVLSGEPLFNAYVANAGAAAVEETFDAYDGFYSDPFAGSTGSIDWIASATGGLFAQGGVFSTNSPSSLQFSFDPGAVQGVGGTMFGTDFDFGVVPAIIAVELDDGTTYISYVTSSDQFIGFWSTDASIVSFTISAESLDGSDVFPSIDTMVMAVVPAPAPITLLGAIGLAGRRRRR